MFHNSPAATRATTKMFVIRRVVEQWWADDGEDFVYDNKGLCFVDEK